MSETEELKIKITTLLKGLDYG